MKNIFLVKLLVKLINFLMILVMSQEALINTCLNKQQIYNYLKKLIILLINEIKEIFIY